MPTERLDTLLAAIRPPLLDLGVRVIVKLDAALRSVRPLVRVPVRGPDRLVLELGRHRGAHRFVARALRGPVGQVEDLLVQPGGVLRRRRARQTFLFLFLGRGGVR